MPAADGDGQFFGDVWEWTPSSLLALPRLPAARGALGEYNGKFMANQMVLRGGSLRDARARTSARPTAISSIRHDRWQFIGIRLAE